jgi:PAS domain S-box-containing protein
LRSLRYSIERKKMEEDLKRQHAILTGIVESPMAPIFSVDCDYCYTSFNSTHFAVMKALYGVDIAIGKSLLDYQTNIADRATAKSNIDRALTGEIVTAEAYSGDENLIRSYFVVSHNPIRDADGNITGVAIFASDITGRKQAEDAIIRSKLLLQNVIDSTPDWMYVKDFEHKYLLVNRSFAEAQNMAPQDMIGRADIEFFSEELCLGSPDKGIDGYHTNDNQAFQGRTVHNSHNMITWADGSPHVFDTYKIPLSDQFGRIYGALVYSRDITDRVKAEEQREAALESLRSAMHGVINTMARVVEMRDPYTAGHQQRVGDLAGAIAREMRLDDSRVEHLIMAANIHEIGKMFVPSDILSRPGKLSDIEFSLIKAHAQGSFDIIRDIEFDQPVALMTLQHHERLDGSGYPKGLKGDEIMTESRILAVADVVEAMSSHRPYRPALGIEKALEEISKNKGTLYDPDAVGACLKLFKEKQFQFD